MKIKIRRGTAAAISAANPTLASGELCIETDTNRMKCGDGVTAWNNLLYLGTKLGAAKNSEYDENESVIATISNATEAAQFISDYHIDTGKFDSLKLGQRIIIKGSGLDGSDKDWLIAGFDFYLNVCGNKPINRHHLALIPFGNTGSAVMNDTNVTTGGYKGSKMHTVTMATQTTRLQATLGSKLIQHDRLLSNSVSGSLIGRYGSASGATNGWEWVDTYCELMTENQLYGGIIWASSGYDIGEGCEKLPLFNFRYPVKGYRGNFWLRAVASSTDFAYCDHYGYANHYDASGSSGVRPLIFIG